MADQEKCIDAFADHSERMHAAQALTAMPGSSQGRTTQGPSPLIAQSSLEQTLLELTRQIAQQRLLEQLVRDRQMINVASDTSLNLKFGCNRNPEAKSSVRQFLWTH